MADNNPDSPACSNSRRVGHMSDSPMNSLSVPSIASRVHPRLTPERAVLPWQSELRGPAVGAAGAIHGVSKMGQSVTLELRPRRPQAPPGQVFGKVPPDSLLGPDRRVPRRMPDEAHAHPPGPAPGAARAGHGVPQRLPAAVLELPIRRPLGSIGEERPQLLPDPLVGPAGASALGGSCRWPGRPRRHARNRSRMRSATSSGARSTAPSQCSRSRKVESER
jgi:hypothetical protein